MANIDFPIPSYIGETYTFGTTTWTWNGYAWVGSGGSAGSAGTSGSDGSSGTSGMGSPGTDGSSGSSGTSGVGLAGSSGTSGVGLNGTSGINGLPGSSGTSGFHGSSGTSGVGSPGSSGTSGSSGSAGSSGTSGVGSAGTSGANGSSGTSSSGVLNYQQTAGTSVTINNGSTGTVISAPSITTTGRPVQIIVAGDANNISAAGWVRLQLYRDTTPIGKVIQGESSSANENIPYAFNYIDTPSAGSYVYSLKAITVSGSNFQFGEADGPVISVVELAGAGTSGINGTSGSSGLSGTSGSSGTSGVGSAGTSGSSGLSGTSGSSGTSGVGSAGTSGTSGLHGSSGTSGIGSSGTSGFSGSSGTSGSSGSSGSSGLSGTSGSSGLSGTSGSSGTSGVGSSGTSGRRGTVWFEGSANPLATIPGLMDGDFYLQTTDNTTWQFAAGSATWYLLGSIGGTSGISGTSGTSGFDGTSGTSAIGTLLYGKTVFVDEVNGNNMTGSVGDMTKPYASITVACNAAITAFGTTGYDYTIHIFCGTYNETVFVNTIPNGMKLSLYFETNAKATWNVVGGGGSIFSLGGAASSLNISGTGRSQNTIDFKNTNGIDTGNGTVTVSNIQLTSESIHYTAPSMNCIIKSNAGSIKIDNSTLNFNYGTPSTTYISNVIWSIGANIYIKSSKLEINSPYQFYRSGPSTVVGTSTNASWCIFDDVSNVSSPSRIRLHQVVLSNINTGGGGFIYTNPTTANTDTYGGILFDDVYFYSANTSHDLFTLWNDSTSYKDTYTLASPCTSGGQDPDGVLGTTSDSWLANTSTILTNSPTVEGY